MENIKTHLKSLIQLAVADQHFVEKEKIWIYSIGKANKIPEQEIDDMVTENLKQKGNITLNFSALSFDEKFEYLCNMVQLMKIDSEVFLSEINYCKTLAEKLGFDKKVINVISQKVYSDPEITTNREALKKEVKQFQKQD